MIERADPDALHVIGGTQEDVRKFIESDYRIRSGLCPNGCGLMHQCEWGQECPACRFSTNVDAEKADPS